MNILLYAEVNLMSLAVLTIIAIGMQSREKSRRESFFEASVWCSNLAVFCDLLWNIGQTSYLTISQANAYAVNFVYFLGLSSAAFFMFLYFENPVQSCVFKSRLAMAAAALPVAVMAGLLIRSLFDGCIFYIDDAGEYHRGSAFYMQLILSYGYVVAAAAEKLVHAIRRTSFTSRDEFYAVLLLAAPMLLSGFLQSQVPNAPISAIGIVLAELLIYIHSLQQMVSTDVLTGISNRRELLRVLAEQTEALKREDHLYFLFIDIDSFKQINDIYGHNEGDRVLKLVASVLKRLCLETNGYCGRYGGDEFAVLQRVDSEEEIAAFRRKIHDSVEKKSKAEALAYTVRVSIGCAEYIGDGMEIHELISQADSNMYHRKNHKRDEKLSL